MPVGPLSIDIVAASMRYGDRTVFTDFSARLPASQITALVGPSGSGKSTLPAALAGHQRLKSGAVHYIPANTARRFPADPSYVSWVPQGNNALGRRSVLDNVAIAALSEGAHLSNALVRAREALNMVGLTKLLDQQARRLSGGELQRLAFARALASTKEIIVADEPSANLDAANTEVLAGTLGQLASGRTIIIATHDPLLATAAQVVVNMREDHGAAGPVAI